jgi:DNA (cytosine-5)-methyltransferase 1
MRKVIDLFAGVGGLSQGFQMAGFEIIMAIEHDKEIAKSYKKNHTNTIVIADDIQNINLAEYQNEIKGVDIIIGGPPCQGFSQKGKRLTFDDDRNFLFNSFVKIVEDLKPEFFLLENVSNILSAGNQYFKNEIIEKFTNIGYEVTSGLLNAAHFGVPQERKRAFFLGQLGKLNVELPADNGMRTTIKEAIYDLPFIQSGEGKQLYEYEKVANSDYQHLMRKNSKGIYNHFSTKHSELALERLALIPFGKGKEVLPEHHRTKSIYSGTWSRLLENGTAATITTRFDTPSSGLFTHPILNRCLTVREAARIQSFPDNFIFYGPKTSQMKQVGNAVPPLLAYAVAQNIANYYQNRI